MKKTPLTISILSSIIATSAFAEDKLNSKVVHEAVNKYSAKVEYEAKNDESSAIYAVNDIASDAADIKTNGSRFAKGVAIESGKIPNAIKPKDMYFKGEDADYAAGLEKYRAERDEIQETINRWTEKRKGKNWFSKKNYDRKIAQKKAEKKAINTKIDIIKSAEAGDSKYAKVKLEQFETIKNLTVNGPKSYSKYIAKPISTNLAIAFDAAKRFDYEAYRNGMDQFWTERVQLWNSNYNIPGANETDMQTAVEFNNVTNYLTIQAIAAIQKEDIEKATVQYADANALVYQVTTLGDIESQVQATMEENAYDQTRLFGMCQLRLNAVNENNTITKTRTIIGNLADQKTIETTLTQLLSIIRVGDIKVYNLNSLGNNLLTKAAVAAIKTTIGSEGIVYVKGNDLMLRPASALAGPISNAISSSNIYQEINASDSIMFGTDACNFEAASQSNNPIAKTLVATTIYISEEIAEGGIVDPALNSKVYLALQSTIFENLERTLPNK